MRGKEQHLRFTLTAADLLYRFSPLQHVATLGPDDPSTMIWVDALPPVIAFGPRVDYTTASGTAPQCGTDGPTYQCGRQGQTHLLADDTATVTFDAYDCGAGMAQAQPAATVATKATSQTAAVSEKGRGGSPCSNGSTNKTHHYNFTLNLATLALSYDAPGTSGTTPVQLVANLQDRLLQGASSSPGAPTSADGAALVSLWRWKSQFAPNAQPSGSPALLPGSAGSRQIAIGTTLPPSSPNFFVLNADGTQPWNATVQIGIAGDVAAGSGGALYTVTPPAGSCGSGCNAALNILTAPSGSGTTGAVQACAASNVSFGAPPVIITATATIPERAVVASTSHAVGATANVFLFQSGCTSTETDLVGTGDFPGISANWPTLFLATGQGFSSADHSDAAGRFGTPAAYNSGNTVPTVSPPAIASGAPVNAIFAGSADDFVHRTASSTCTTLSCWTDVSGFAPAMAQSSLPFTPVFDATAIYAADAQGKVYAVDKVSGAASWSFDFRNGALPSPWPSGSGTTVSPPILLQGGTALVVRSDGVVALASAAGPVPLLQMTKALTGAPAAPVIDIRGTGGVAYVHDGAGWIYALQLQSPPATPGSAVWPRPGRDSCNSRNAASSCQ